MKITIDTQLKTVTIDSMSINETEKIKTILAAMGESAEQYQIVSAYYSYPVYNPYQQVVPYIPDTNNPSWIITTN